MTVNWLQILLSPAFVTLKQREPTLGLRQSGFLDYLAVSEFVGLTASLDHARAIIPTPSYPNASEKKEEFHHRYGWENEQLSDGGLLRQIPEVRFDDHPESEGHARDRQMFGVSFIVLWLCPFDLKRIQEYLHQLAAQLMHSPERSSSFRRFQETRHQHCQVPWSRQWHKQDLVEYLKLELIDRLCLLEPVEEDTLLTIKSELRKAFHVNGVTSAPDPLHLWLK